MAFETIASGLTLQIPTQGTRNWASTIKTQCFQKISSHDHTGSGKGVQIGTNAIASAAVTTAKIADSNVTTAKVLDGAVTEAKLDDDAASRSCHLFTGISGAFSGTVGATTLTIAGVNTRFVAAKACKVTYLTLAANDTRFSGSVTVQAYKNGSAVVGATVSLSSGSGFTAYGSISAISLAAGDTLDLRYTSSSIVWGLGGTASIVGTAIGHYTE